MKNKKVQIAIIITTIIISWVLAMTVDLNRLELGALANFFFPPLIGVITIVIYLLGSWLIKGSKNFFLVLCSFINLGVGIALHFFDF